MAVELEIHFSKKNIKKEVKEGGKYWEKIEKSKTLINYCCKKRLHLFLPSHPLLYLSLHSSYHPVPMDVVWCVYSLLSNQFFVIPICLVTFSLQLWFPFLLPLSLLLLSFIASFCNNSHPTSTSTFVSLSLWSLFSIFYAAYIRKIVIQTFFQFLSTLWLLFLQHQILVCACFEGREGRRREKSAWREILAIVITTYSVLLMPCVIIAIACSMMWDWEWKVELISTMKRRWWWRR